MPSNNLHNEISPSQFVNIIKSLVQGKYLYHYWRSGDGEISYIQLPEIVSTHFRRLDLSLHSKKMSTYYDSNQEFDKFVGRLVNSARGNYWSPTSEKAHAEYLLGFLLHNNFYIRLNETTLISIEDLVYRKLPSYEADYFKTGSHYRWHTVPNKKYDFLSSEWRAQQKYPNMDTVKQYWQQILTEKENKKIAKEQERQKKEQEYQLRQQQYQWELQHRFTHIVLDFRLFSYALEAYITLIESREEHCMQDGNLPIASTSLRTLISQFTQYARTMDPNNPQHHQIVANMLDALMIHLMREAKYESTLHGAYAKRLLGFLLHHNFKVNGFGKTYTMQEIFWHNSTEYEKSLLQFSHSNHHLFFALPGWQQNQNYPNKPELEYALHQSHQKQVLAQQMHQPNTFLRAYQPMALQSPFLQPVQQKPLYQSTQLRSILGY
ncbi:hypothetical protein CC99x_008545 [Candidatus Berkiella cookevillensis]|uniref:Uncharacterized protein n=1 Tax=Candidatus Berkiella cookevillensis TaxID=437022 RepID=A0A0Q9YFM9_9GAMM|nr:hypothetical protein [Candidatus Berkiella cookevillensis]MCS5708948.1 hypothetical protein [Candidatus Berkiella cookevillensis]